MLLDCFPLRIIDGVPPFVFSKSECGKWYDVDAFVISQWSGSQVPGGSSEICTFVLGLGLSINGSNRREGDETEQPGSCGPGSQQRPCSISVFTNLVS